MRAEGLATDGGDHVAHLQRRLAAHGWALGQGGEHLEATLHRLGADAETATRTARGVILGALHGDAGMARVEFTEQSRHAPLELVVGAAGRGHAAVALHQRRPIEALHGAVIEHVGEGARRFHETVIRPLAAIDRRGGREFHGLRLTATRGACSAGTTLCDDGHLVAGQVHLRHRAGGGHLLLLGAVPLHAVDAGATVVAGEHHAITGGRDLEATLVAGQARQAMHAHVGVGQSVVGTGGLAVLLLLVCGLVITLGLVCFGLRRALGLLGIRRWQWLALLGGIAGVLEVRLLLGLGQRLHAWIQCQRVHVGLVVHAARQEGQQLAVGAESWRAIVVRMSREVDRLGGTVRWCDPDVAVEVAIILRERDPLRVGAPAPLDLVVPTRAEHTLGTAGQIEQYQIAVAAERQRLAVGTGLRFALGLRRGDHGLDVEGHGFGPSRRIQAGILWLRVLLLLVVLRGFVLLRLLLRLFLRLRVVGRLRLGGGFRLRRIRLRFILGGRRVLLHILLRFLGLGRLLLGRVGLLADLAAGARHQRLHHVVVAACIGDEVQARSIGAPRDVALVPWRAGHAHHRRLLIHAAHEHVAVGHECHRLAVRAGLRLGDVLVHLAHLHRIGLVGAGVDHQCLRLGIGLGQVQSVQLRAARQEHGVSVGAHVEGGHIVGERGQLRAAGLDRVLQRLAVQVHRAVTVGEVQVRIGAQPLPLAVVAHPAGEALERLLGRLARRVGPHIACIRTVVAATQPAVATALEKHHAVGVGGGARAEGVVHACKRAAFKGNLVGAHGAVQVALPRSIHHHHRLAVGAGSKTTQQHGTVAEGELAWLAARRGHGPDVARTFARTLEHQRRSIAREDGAQVVARIRGQSHGFTTGRGRTPQVAAPTEHHAGAIGTGSRITRQFHRGGHGVGGEQGQQEGGGGHA